MLERAVSGSPAEWAKNVLGAEYSYEISIANDAIVPASEIRPASTSFLAAIEVIWKNGDRRATFKTGI